MQNSDIQAISSPSLGGKCLVESFCGKVLVDFLVENLGENAIFDILEPPAFQK